MSRTRLIRPEFFADEDMARLSIPTRLVYIGLWTLCDDAGWFERKPRTIAAALFPFDGADEREARLVVALAELEEALRIRRLECGRHAIVPTLPRWIQKGGTHAFTHRSQHQETCVALTPIRPSGDDASGRVRTRLNKSLSESDSESWSESESDGLRGLHDAAAAAGGFVGHLAARARS